MKVVVRQALKAFGVGKKINDAEWQSLSINIFKVSGNIQIVIETYGDDENTPETTYTRNFPADKIEENIVELIK